MNKILKNTLILTAITLVAGIALGFVYEITKEPIANAQLKAKQEACKQVLPEADEFGEIVIDTDKVDEVYGALKGGEEIGYVVTATCKEGYGGDIQVSVGITKDGEVKGIALLSISETAGLGMRATEPEFYDQYAGKQTDQFYVSKDGGEGEPIEAISGATITSRAVTKAVNTALEFYHEELGGRVNE